MPTVGTPSQQTAVSVLDADVDCVSCVSSALLSASQHTLMRTRARTAIISDIGSAVVHDRRVGVWWHESEGEGFWVGWLASWRPALSLTVGAGAAQPCSARSQLTLDRTTILCSTTVCASDGISTACLAKRDWKEPHVESGPDVAAPEGQRPHSPQSHTVRSVGASSKEAAPRL